MLGVKTIPIVTYGVIAQEKENGGQTREDEVNSEYEGRLERNPECIIIDIKRRGPKHLTKDPDFLGGKTRRLKRGAPLPREN